MHTSSFVINTNYYKPHVALDALDVNVDNLLLLMYTCFF